MNILAVTSRSPWRLTVAVTGAPSLTLADYTITRQDGLTTHAAPKQVWLVGVNTVEISLSEALFDAVVYVLTLPNEPGPPSMAVAYRQPLDPTAQIEPEPEDIEAEAYGIDTDWITGSRDPSGDLTDIRGAACFKNDLITIAMIAPREIYHRPDDGGGLPLDVNAPSTPNELARQRGALASQWRKDDRVREVAVTSTTNASGQVVINGNIVDAVAQQVQNVVLGRK